MGRSFQHEGLSLEYETIGNGKKTMLAFHGFGSSSGLFRILEPSLGKHFTIYSFNLPYHGNSHVSHQLAEKGITSKFLNNYFTKFLESISTNEFSLIAYSIGGKLALTLIGLFPEKIKEVFLFAPDGIKISPWYKFVTGTPPGKWIYKRLMHHPDRYLRMVNALERVKLLDSRTANFVKGTLNSPLRRMMVFNTWMSLKNIRPDMGHIRQTINSNRIRIHLFFGKYDKLIPPAIGIRFSKGLDQRDALHILDTGHQLIREKTNAEINKILSG